MSSGSDASTQPTNNMPATGNSTQPTVTTGSARRSHSPEGSPAPPDAPQAQVMIQCDAVVETYRTGVNPSKPDVLAQIIRVLTEFFNARPGHDADFNNALRVYVEMLDSYENKQCILHREGENQVRARARNEMEEGRPRRPRAADFHEEEVGGENSERGESEQGENSDDGGDDDGDVEDGPGPAKRLRIDESQFLWQPVREISRALLHPELQLTLKLIENYTLDLKAARRSLTNSPECPEFPEEQWLALLAGKAVNLDSVFAADHSTSINEVQTHEISEGIAIRLSENLSNPAEAKRVIKNADKWTTTWHTYTQAVLVAFPHRYRELALYQQYMSSLFRTTAIPLHCRIFVLDYATSSAISSDHISHPPVWRTKSLKKVVPTQNPSGRTEIELESSTLADDGMPECARPRMGNVVTSTFVRTAREDTLSPLALEESERGGEGLEGRGRFERESRGGDWEDGDVGFAPKYKRGFVFSAADTGRSRAAGCTEFELPVLWPPAREFENAEAIKTIEEHPQLFKIMTPIKVDILEECLATHPNPAFVKSVIIALKEGFWPWADTHHAEDFPITWDNSRMSPRSDMEQKFIVGYRDEEIAAGCFSEPFGSELLPGMYSTPVHAVPKPYSDDFCMVSNMSAGLHAPNRMILHSDIAGSCLDGLHTLFSAILCFKSKSPENVCKVLVVFKSDMSKAYRLCPMHPLWQLKQVVTTGYLTSEQKAAGEVEILVRTVDSNNNFSGRGSGRVWYSVNSLITWVAINVEDIEDLGCYVNDDFGFDEWGKLEYYEPYDTFYPTRQTKLLKLWDRLGVPHSKPKQLFGLQLVVIGFNVNPNAMTTDEPRLPWQRQHQLRNEIG
ncbi:uncharacterized protein ARMOST_03309 [Armillaria ostoyae]|uniref:Uncharacterized protein n=1 Tax=Armillaria ostoyae TaxID=47428 RepID=A0A284QU30_ARMOS|nr:uncharacterized protein ARMOST_03309 [Armillaria ostoyae]